MMNRRAMVESLPLKQGGGAPPPRSSKGQPAKNADSSNNDPITATQTRRPDYLTTGRIARERERRGGEERRRRRGRRRRKSVDGLSVSLVISRYCTTDLLNSKRLRGCSGPEWRDWGPPYPMEPARRPPPPARPAGPLLS